MKFKKILFRILIPTLLLSACDAVEPIDDLEPKFKLTEDNVYTDKNKIEANLNGMYLLWREASGGYMPGLLEALSGNYESSFSTDFNNNSIAVENGEIKDLYANLYSVIQESSYIIDNLIKIESVEGMSNVRKLEIEAEARCSRAMAHFLLLESFGEFYNLNSKYGIVVRKEPARDISAPARSTVMETYEAILEDLDFAAQYAPEISVHYKLSRTVAMAYKSKVFLYMGKYTECAQQATEVMVDVNYSLENNYTDVFVNTYNSSEVLFAPFATANENIFVTDNYINPKEIAVLADQEVEDPVSGPKAYDKRYQYAHIDIASTGVPNQKYLYRGAIGDQQADTYIKLRMAEVYLIYAEANARMANAVDDANAIEAIDKLNVIRLRAGMSQKNPLTVTELLEVIRIEKALELFGEVGQTWFDMVRYHVNNDINISDVKPTVVSDHQLIFPIPKSALAGNPALEQNPGY